MLLGLQLEPNHISAHRWLVRLSLQQALTRPWGGKASVGDAWSHQRLPVGAGFWQTLPTFHILRSENNIFDAKEVFYAVDKAELI